MYLTSHSRVYDKRCGMSYVANFIQKNINSKKCWVVFNPILGQIWTNPAIG